MLLDIPLNGLDPELNYLGTKSGSRKVFREAGVPLSAGLRGSARTRTTSSARCVELGAQAAGPAPRRRQAERQLLRRGQRALPLSLERDAASRCTTRWTSSSSPCRANRTENYFRKFERMGGVVEEFIDAPHQAVAERAAAHHAARRGGGDLDARSDSRRPVRADLSRAARSRRTRTTARAIQEAGTAVGQRARPRTARSAASASTSWCGSQRPARAVADGRARDQPARAGHDPPVPGAAVPDRRPARSRQRACSCRSAAAPSTTWPPTTCASGGYRGMLPEDLIDIVTNNGLHYSYRTESGVLFHLIGALSEWGKLGRHGHRQQPRRGQRALSTHARRARSRGRHRATRPKTATGEEHA